MNTSPFETIKKINEHQQEYRRARELSKVLEYTDYRNFLKAVEKAKVACKNSGQLVNEHFVEANKSIKSGKGAIFEVEDVILSRYACYLIVQNADPSKEIVALGQTYFAIQTRNQELHQQYLEDEKRVESRDEISYRNKKLATTAKVVGVNDYAEFVDYGYMGLYGGMRAKDIHEHKKLKADQKILDHMGSEELGANIFRATQTEAKIRREGINGQIQASKTHFEVGKEIRKTIKKLGGTMPENLPVADNIRHARKRITNKKTNPITGNFPVIQNSGKR